MRFERHKHRHGPALRHWEIPDSPLMLDEFRALFGESEYMSRYLQMASFKDLIGGKAESEQGRAVDDPAFEGQFPTLFFLMVHTTDDEGKPRLPCTLTIVCEDGQVKCGINERNHHLSLWTSCGGLGAVFASLEEALSERPVKWRKVQWKGRGGKP